MDGIMTGIAITFVILCAFVGYASDRLSGQTRKAQKQAYTIEKGS